MSSSDSAFHTPPPRSRRRLDDTSATSASREKYCTPSPKQPTKLRLSAPKTVYLIRHGQSLGQTATRHARKNDSGLLDCGLTVLGCKQAEALPLQLGPEAYQEIELVVCSPLTRAMQTAALGFPDKKLLCHFDLREVGSMIPENQPRPVHHVLKDLGLDSSRVDVDTLRPDAWPKRRETPPKVVRRDRIREIVAWLATRDEACIAVVCHFHVIRSLLSTPYQSTQIKPANAEPIRCEIGVDGILSVVSVAAT